MNGGATGGRTRRRATRSPRSRARQRSGPRSVVRAFSTECSIRSSVVPKSASRLSTYWSTSARIRATSVGGLGAELVGAGDGAAVDLGLGDQPLVLGERRRRSSASRCARPSAISRSASASASASSSSASARAPASSSSRWRRAVPSSSSRWRRADDRQLLALAARAAGEALGLGLGLLEDLGALLDDRAGGLRRPRAGTPAGRRAGRAGGRAGPCRSRTSARCGRSR